MRDLPNLYPRLANSFKGKYPFRIGTTSFIYPDYYVPNVRILGPYLDEIELLLFESAQVDSLFSRSVINELHLLSQDLNLTYNIHLPTDIAINDPDSIKQQFAVDTLIHIIERLEPLNASSYALHIPYHLAFFDERHVKKWQEVVYHNLERILAAGIPGNKIAIETLEYPYEMLNPILSELPLSVCIDVGHLIMHGYDFDSVFKSYYSKTLIIHLHGIENNIDHQSLIKLSKQVLDSILKQLNTFTESVSLEVFSFEDLNTSLDFLQKCWEEMKC